MKTRWFTTVLILSLTILSAAGAEDWYISSPNGIPGHPLSRGPAPGGWSLSIDRSENREERNLYLDGELQTSTLFVREDGQLISRQELDSSGRILSRVEYAYDPQGNPRAVFIGTDDREAGTRRIATDQSVVASGEIHRRADGVDGDWLITDLDENHNPLEQRSFKDSELVEDVAWERDNDGTLREEIRTRGDEVSRSFYDRDGRLVRDTTSRNGTVIRVRNYSWDGADLVRVEEQGEGRMDVREMTWIAGRLERETRSIDGVLRSETFWTSGEDRVETLYRDGEAVIRVYWSGNTREREEFLKGGEVVRVQEHGQ